MDPISNADRLVLLLKQKLQERSKSGTAAGAARKQKPDVEPVPPASAPLPLAALEGADERPLRRAFIQNLLADQMGPALINDAQFQQIVARVTEAIEEDPDAFRLLSRLIADLRA